MKRVEIGIDHQGGFDPLTITSYQTLTRLWSEKGAELCLCENFTQGNFLDSGVSHE